MKKILQILAAAAGLTAIAATPALAQFSANGTIISNYVWRGVTQSSDNPAVQAGIDYGFGNGLAVGAWASSIDFGDQSPLELDIYGSYAGELGTMGTGFEVGVIGYLYPNSDSASPDFNFVEFYGGLSHDFGPAAVSGTIYYSPDSLGTSTIYYTGGLSIPVSEMFGLAANVGHYDYETGTDYTDWNVGASVAFDIFTLSLMYSDNDLPGDQDKIILGISFATP